MTPVPPPAVSQSLPQPALDTATVPAIPLHILDRLERVWPFSLFFNAVFQKEMRAAGRRSGTYLIRAIYMGLMLMLVSLFLIRYWQSSDSGSGAAQVQEIQQMAPTLAVAVVWFAFCMLALLAPAMTVPAFIDERRRRALPALMTTPLTSGQIVCAKLLSQTIQLIILALLAVPVLLAVRVFGGVPASFLLQSTAILLSTALLVATLGLRFSLFSRRADTAIIGSLVIAALIQGGPVFVLAMTGVLSGGPPPFMTILPVTCSPIALMTLTFELQGGGGFPPWATSWMWIGNSLYNCGWAVIFVLSTTSALRRVLRLEGAGINYLKPRRRSRRHTTAEALPAAHAAPAAGAGDAGLSASAAPTPRRRQPRRRVHSPREVGDRPVLWRELRLPTFRNRVFAVIITCVLAAFMLFLYAVVDLAEEGLYYPVVVIASIAILLQAAAASSSTLTAERDARTWETLLTTPISPAEIVWSKFAGVIRRQWYIPLLLGGHLLITSAAGKIHPVVFLHLALVYVGPVLLLSASGIFFSLVIKRSTPAAVLNIVAGLFLWVAVPLLATLVAEIFEIYGGPVRTFAESVLFPMNPVAQAVVATGGALDHRATLTYESLEGTTDLAEYTVQLAIVAASYALFAVLLLLLTIRRFSAVAGRSS